MTILKLADIKTGLVFLMLSASSLAQQETAKGLSALGDKDKLLYFVPRNSHDQSILHLAPPLALGGVNISLWSAPITLGHKNRLRSLNIKSHGPNDYYDDSYHISFYTTDKQGNQPKAFEWHWGPEYNATLKIPTMGLRLSRIYNEATGPVTSAFGILIDSPKLKGHVMAENYGLYIKEQAASYKKNYAIYSEGPASYFSGNTGFNEKNPKYAIDVDGDINFSGQLLRNGDEISNVSCVTLSSDSAVSLADSIVFHTPYKIEVARVSGATTSNGPSIKWNLSVFSPNKFSSDSEMYKRPLVLTKEKKSVIRKAKHVVDEDRIIKLNIIEAESLVSLNVNFCYRLIAS